jgi:hypothetical protein
MLADLKCCIADTSGRVDSGICLAPLASWDYGRESHQRYEFLSLVIVVWCQVESLCLWLITCPGDYYRVWCV